MPPRKRSRIHQVASLANLSLDILRLIVIFIGTVRDLYVLARACRGMARIREHSMVIDVFGNTRRENSGTSLVTLDSSRARRRLDLALLGSVLRQVTMSSLSLSRFFVSDLAFDAIRSRRLQSLYLREHCVISDRLGDLSTLDTLELGMTQVPDLNFLSSLPNLTALGFSLNSVGIRVNVRGMLETRALVQLSVEGMSVTMMTDYIATVRADPFTPSAKGIWSSF